MKIDSLGVRVTDKDGDSIVVARADDEIRREYPDAVAMVTYRKASGGGGGMVVLDAPGAHALIEALEGTGAQ